MPTLSRGVLIALEGIDGSGKTVLAHQLFKTLTEQDYRVLLTKEPSNSPLGIYIRTIFKEKEISIVPQTQYLLFAADRAEHFQKLIIPALSAHNIVISDRLGDSSIVYQGYGQNVDNTMIKKINRWTMNDREPDIVFYIKLDISRAQLRIKQRNNEDAFDQKSPEFFKKIMHGYETEFAQRKNVITLDGNLPSNQLTQEVTNHIITWITNNNLIQQPL